ncbi:MAG: luxQ 7 [Gammaproteobacteria bacterium]|nr:luxQ 7 [Gammaproteobacteria bacterium]
MSIITSQNGGVAATVQTRTRVLVADDNRDAAQALALLLELEGYETEVAFDGSEAVDAAEQFRPQIVILDIGMPLMDGNKAAEQIRERPWGGWIHILALTAGNESHDRERAAAAGFDRYFVKPINPAAFLELIAQLSKVSLCPRSVPRHFA